MKSQHTCRGRTRSTMTNLACGTICFTRGATVGEKREFGVDSRNTVGMLCSALNRLLAGKRFKNSWLDPTGNELKNRVSFRHPDPLRAQTCGQHVVWWMSLIRGGARWPCYCTEGHPACLASA